MNKVSYQLEDTVSGMILVKFKFCHNIIKCIKQIPGFKYNDKKWYIPTDFMDLLSEKLLIEEEQDMHQTKTKKRKDMNDRIDYIKENHGLDFADTDSYEDSINCTMSDEKILIHLPVSRYVYSVLRNYPNLTIKTTCDDFSWLIEGCSNMATFIKCCKDYRFIAYNFKGLKPHSNRVKKRKKFYWCFIN